MAFPPVEGAKVGSRESTDFKGTLRQPISRLTTQQMTGPEANPGPPAREPAQVCQAAAAAMDEDHPDLSTALLLGPKSPYASETAFWYSESSFKESVKEA